MGGGLSQRIVDRATESGGVSKSKYYLFLYKNYVLCDINFL